MSSIRLKGICKSFGGNQVVRDLDLEITNGEFIVVVGPSGCGKTTLLRIIAGLEKPDAGEIHFNGERANDMPPDRRHVSMVFQDYALYPNMTVRENMAFSLMLAGAPKAEQNEKVAEVSRILRLNSLLDRKPESLSGGECQRVAIGRAIVPNPNVFLFDEPLSNLDASLRIQMRVEIARLHNRLQSTMIYVTHDQTEAMTLADRIVVLQDGVAEQTGTPLDLYHHPVNQFVAGFIGTPRMNFLTATVTQIATHSITVKLPGTETQLSIPAIKSSLKVDDSVTIGVRPEHLSTPIPYDDKANSEAPVERVELPEHRLTHVQGNVIVVERLGSETFLYVQTTCSEQPLALRAPSDCVVHVHDSIDVQIQEDACHLFDMNGIAIKKPIN